MWRKSFYSFILIAFSLTASESARAQNDASSRSGEPTKVEDFPKGIQESLVKQRIDREKKDYAEMLARGEEAVKISSELEKSFARNSQLSVEDRKKLDRLEKLVKKIRSELGGDDDDETAVIDDQPLSMQNAFGALQNTTIKLADELKKTTRYTVSVVAVESSNLLLKVVRFLRFGKKNEN